MREIKIERELLKRVLVENNITELSFGDIDELADPTYIIWFDKDCLPHEDPVIAIRLENNNLCLVINARESEEHIDLEENSSDFVFENDQWLYQILGNVVEVLEKQGIKVHLPDKPSLVIEQIKSEFDRGDYRMEDILASQPVNGLSLQEGFDAYIELMKWANGDKFYRSREDNGPLEL